MNKVDFAISVDRSVGAGPMLLVAMLLWAAPKVAADQRHPGCERYAAAAVGQQQQNLELGCGLSGPAWNADHSAHYNWCMHGENHERFAAAEERRRAERLASCRSAATPPGRVQDTACTDYAETAVGQHQENLDRDCGFTGPRWSPDFQGHYAWCLDGDNLERFAPAEQKRRAEALEACSTGGGLDAPNPAAPAAGLVRVWNSSWEEACKAHCSEELAPGIVSACLADQAAVNGGVDCAAEARAFSGRCALERCRPFPDLDSAQLLRLARAAALEFEAVPLQPWDSFDYLGPDGKPGSRLEVFTTLPGVPGREKIAALLSAGKTGWNGSRWEDLFRAVEIGRGDLLPPVLGFWQGLPAELALEAEAVGHLQRELGATAPQLTRRHGTALFPVLEFSDPSGPLFFYTSSVRSSRVLEMLPLVTPTPTREVVAKRVQFRGDWNRRLDEID
ncbi:MAG: hypothetical protein HND55_12530 [Pseudomonadota bacterium]|nr:MAG: hypothetical protein HND55_12530 [Pseudomonadota bacterium]